jgi:hypothetical protein
MQGGGQLLLQDSRIVSGNWKLQQPQGGALRLANLQQVSSSKTSVMAGLLRTQCVAACGDRDVAAAAAAGGELLQNNLQQVSRQQLQQQQDATSRLISSK